MGRRCAGLGFTPFTAGCLVVFVAVLFFFTYDEKPELIAALDSRAVDTMFRLRGATPTTGQIIIVDIDEKSLQALGQWPWPRDQVAQLVERIREAGARVVGFDIVFAEEDRTSPHRIIDQLRTRAPQILASGAAEAVHADPALDNDLIFGQSLGELTSVLGYVFLTMEDGLKDPAAMPLPSIDIRTVPEHAPFAGRLVPAYRAIINVPAVAQSTSEGFFNFFPDSSGLVRKVPLFLSMDGIPYPSLALEMLRLGLGEEAVTIHIPRLHTSVDTGVLGIGMGQRFIATDNYCQLAINYRGPVGTFPYIPAIDLLQGQQLETLQDKYVLIGTSAAGLHDLRATSFSTAFPGVEIQATIIDNILAGDALTHDPIAERGLTLVLIIAGGLLLSAFLAYGSPLVGGLGALALFALSMIGNYYYFFLNHEIVGLTYPLLVLLAVFPVVSILNYFFEGKEKRFIDMAFGRYVSPQVVQQLKRNPKQLSLAGEERVLTVLFSDIRGFTSLSEKIAADQLGLLMNRYLTAMSRIILDQRGTVDKFIGDAIMAIWGAPLEDHGHASNCVRAALHMQAQLEVLRPAWMSEGLPQIEMGIGINTGEMIVGNFGSEERFDYTVIGDQVNLASRLEVLTKFYEVPIVISEFTRAALGPRFLCRTLDRVRVKGRSQSVSIYQPLLEGEPEESLQKEMELHEAALAAYFSRSFAEAEERFRELLARNPQHLYRLFIQRCTFYNHTPPAVGWDGVADFALNNILQN